MDAYDEREEDLGDELMRALERFMLLQIIDERWREHLHDMDYLREGIHLRGFAQIDPLVAYKNEGFEMFTQLMNNIWDEFARYVFNVEIEVQEPQQQAPAQQQGGPNWGFGGNSSQTGRLTTSGGHSAAGRDAIAAAAGTAVPAGVSEAAELAADEVSASIPTGGDAPPRRAREDRPQRPMLARLRQEVQEAPAASDASGLRDQLKLLADYL